MSSQRDLWPEDITEPSLIATPLSILKEQATFLGEKTKNLIEGEVRSGGDSNNFVHQFFLLAPALKNYRYRLLTVSHRIELYPVTVSFDPTGQSFGAETQEDFTALLATLFAHEKTKKVIQALKAQIQE